MLKVEANMEPYTHIHTHTQTSYTYKQSHTEMHWTAPSARMQKQRTFLSALANDHENSGRKATTEKHEKLDSKRIK